MPKGRRVAHVIAVNEGSDDSRYRATFHQAGIGIAHTSPDGYVLDVNPALCAMLGYARRELMPLRLPYGLLYGEQRDACAPEEGYDALESLLAGEIYTYGCTEQYRHKSGTPVWVHRTVSVVSESPTARYLLHFIEDITSRKHAEEERRLADLRYQRTLESALDCIVSVDHRGRILEFNPMAEKVFGYARAQVLGRRLADVLVPPWLRERHETILDRLLSPDQPSLLNRRIETTALRADGTTVPVEVMLQRIADTEPPLFIVFLRDMRDRLRLEQKHEEAERRLAHLAHYDQLTSLPNRALYSERLMQGAAHATRNGWTLAALFVNLDRFKTINDTMGHAIGDALLRQVATRLLECVRTEDTVARLSSDEFGIVLAHLTGADDAGLVAGKLLRQLKRPYTVDGLQIVVSASCGIALYPQDGENADVLMRNAHVAMHSAKTHGDGYRFYTTEMNERALVKLQLESRLRGALDRNEFVLHYQPKVALQSSRICGFEALLRWQPPGEPLVPPGEFIPVLEETGMIAAVGEWVLKAACEQIAAWRSAGCAVVPIAINLSARQLRFGAFRDAVARALEECTVEAHLLEIEITESSVMENWQEAQKALTEFKTLGVSLAIDDFGTHYSSLAYLKRFPFDTLKIDRSFVRDIGVDPDDAAIARSIIGLGASLGHTVVAEGVETKEQLAFLVANGCQQAQGFLFSRPVPAPQASELLKNSPPLLRPAPRETRD